MNLPNYFLADLPPEATLSPMMIQEACQTLKRNREHYLAGRSTTAMIRLLGEVASNWLEPEYPFRRFALDQGPKLTGFGAATLAAGLDGFFRELTEEKLQALIVQDLGHAQRLDAPCATSTEQKQQRSALATGPEFIFHIGGGVLPNPLFTSLVLGLLTRSAQFLKCPAGASFLPRLFTHSLYDADPKLGSCLEVAEWKGGNAALENALYAEADCVTATGSDAHLTEIRQQVPFKSRLVTYGHRLSFGYITHGAMSGISGRKLPARAAADVVAWNQLGCLSPHVIYVENGGAMLPDHFAQTLAEELAKREQHEPRGNLPTESAAIIASKRAFYEIRAAHSPDTRHWCSENSTAWTVVYEGDPRFQLSCLNRFIYVKQVRNLEEALQSAESVRGSVSTVGLAATEEEQAELVTKLGRWGVTRVCPLGRMQAPAFTWRHDGRPALGDLVTWTDWEQEWT